MSTRPKKLSSDFRGGTASTYYFQSEVKDVLTASWQTSTYDSVLSLEENRAYNWGIFDGPKQLELIKDEINLRIKITQQEIFKIGELLHLAKRVCQKEKISFQTWIEDNFSDISYETANNFMNVHTSCLAHRNLALMIPISILYKVSKPNFPDELRDYLYTKGNLEQMTNGRLKELVAKYKSGGINAIEGTVEQLHRGALAYKQTLYALDLCEDALRRLLELQTKLFKHDWSSPKEDLFKGHEPEAFENNTLLNATLETCIDIFREALKEVRNDFRRSWMKFTKKHGWKDTKLKTAEEIQAEQSDENDNSAVSPVKPVLTA